MVCVAINASLLNAVVMVCSVDSQSLDVCFKTFSPVFLSPQKSIFGLQFDQGMNATGSLASDCYGSYPLKIRTIFANF